MSTTVPAENKGSTDTDEEQKMQCRRNTEFSNKISELKFGLISNLLFHKIGLIFPGWLCSSLADSPDNNSVSVGVTLSLKLASVTGMVTITCGDYNDYKHYSRMNSSTHSMFSHIIG